MLFLAGSKKEIIFKYLGVIILSFCLFYTQNELIFPKENPISLFILIILITLGMLAAIYTNILKEVLNAIILLLTFISFYLFVYLVFGNELFSWVFGILALIALYLVNDKIWKDIWALVVFSVGVYIISSILSPVYFLLFSAFLVIYDYISVFVTKHMLTLSLPIVEEYFPKFKESKKKIFLLGGGDVIIPIAFCLSFLNSFSNFVTLFGLIFTIYGVNECLNLVLKYKYMPALPVIMFYTLLGVSIGIVIFFI
jgi:presenilin-like A22 family membrane protease